MRKKCKTEGCSHELPEGRRKSYCQQCKSVRRQESLSRYRENHKEEQLLRFRQWCESNPEKRREQRQRDHTVHREVHNEKSRQWAKSNPSHRKDINRCYRARKKGCSVGPASEKKVIEESKGICQACGAFVPQDLRHIDHRVPLKRGGSHSQDNLQLLCRDCNLSKKDKLPEEWSPKVDCRSKKYPQQPALFNPDWADLKGKEG